MSPNASAACSRTVAAWSVKHATNAGTADTAAGPILPIVRAAFQRLSSLQTLIAQDVQQQGQRRLCGGTVLAQRSQGHGIALPPKEFCQRRHGRRGRHARLGNRRRRHAAHVGIGILQSGHQRGFRRRRCGADLAQQFRRTPACLGVDRR